MAPNKELASLTTEEWERIHELVNQYEDLCQQQMETELTQFIPSADDPLYLVILSELIKSDLEHRWRNGEQLLLESYIDKFPILYSKSQGLSQLLSEEYFIRKKYGVNVSLSEYQKRFPNHLDALQKLLEDETEIPATEIHSVTPSQLLPKSYSPGDSLGIGAGYRLLHILDKGQFGKVWKAEAPGGKFVAIKIISWPFDHPASQRELQSLEIVKTINHPFLLDIHAFYPSEDRLIVIMGLADGSLKGLLEQYKKNKHPGIPLEKLLGYMHETAEVLDYLHSRKVQHRDIKPGNLLHSSGHVRVGDLGLAKILQEQVQMNASILGTPPYMAPEIWFGQIHNNSDQYSLAVTYLELRRGLCPFQTATVEGILAEHVQEDPDLPSLTEEEREVLLKAGSKDPEDRYLSCRAFTEALEMATVPKSATVPDEVSDPTTDTKSWVRFLLPLTLILGVVIVAVSLTWWLFRPTGQFHLRSLQAKIPVYAGENTTVTLTIDRQNWNKDITLKLEPVPGIKTKKSVTLQQDQSQIQWELNILNEANPGQHQLTFTAESGQEKKTLQISLNVKPLKTIPVLSTAGTFVPVPEMAVHVVPTKKGRRAFYEQIDCVLNEPQKRTIRFVLIYSKSKQEIVSENPYYIMRDMVWNEVFQVFATKNRELLASVKNRQDDWKQGGVRFDPTAGKTISLGITQLQHPVLRVDFRDATYFANWLGGKLPSKNQWERAAGRYTKPRRSGPYIPGWNWNRVFQAPVRNITFTVGSASHLYAPVWSSLVPLHCYFDSAHGLAVRPPEQGPMPVGTAYWDVNAYGCRDMSGNGYEWTCTSDKGGTYGLDDLKNLDYLIYMQLCSQTYDASECAGRPYRFDDRNKYYRRPIAPFIQGAIERGRPAYYIGFRVVVEPPIP